MDRLMAPTVAFVVLLGNVLPGAARAQQGRGTIESNKTPRSDEIRQGSPLGEVAVDEHLGERMPLDLRFTDHRGRRVELREVFGDRPVLLSFNYFTCPVLCSLMLESAAETMKNVPWTAGEQYEIVTISIDPRDTPERAAIKREQILDKYGKSGDGWHFLVGEPEAIRRATDAAGVRYAYDEAQEQYAHPAVVMFLTPRAELARYLYGLAFEAQDARIALFEAADGNTLSTAERVVLACHQYDPEQGGYSLFGWRVMRYGGGATAVALGAFLAVLWNRERRKKTRPHSARITDE